MTTELTVERRGDIATLTMNRPDKRNALSADLVEALLTRVRAAVDDGTRLLVLRGHGKNFSAGFDFSGYESQSEGDLVHRFVRIELLLQEIHHAPFETLALAHGKNFGAGVDILVACARRLATPDATFRMPGPSFGVILGARRLATRVDPSWAHRVLTQSLEVDAEAALSAGLLTDVAETDAWPSRVTDTARAAGQLPPASRAALGRVLVPDTRDSDLADLVRSVSTPHLKERIRAFRSPGAP